MRVFSCDENGKTIINKTCVIQDLLSPSFRSRNLEEKLNIIVEGRSTPDMPNLTKTKKGDKPGKVVIRHFHASKYEQHDWMTGCPAFNKLYCWPC